MKSVIHIINMLRETGEHDGKDAMFDSSIMGVDGTVDMLLEMINKKFG